MRLLELVPCACTALMPEEAPPASRRALETIPFSPAPRKRRRASCGRPVNWRPSLGTIAEVSAAAAAAGGGEKKVRPVGLPGKAMAGPAGPSGRVLPRSHGDDYRQIGASTAMPTFAPTAFIF